MDLARIAWTSLMQEDRVLSRLAGRLRGSLLNGERSGVPVGSCATARPRSPASLTLLNDALAPPGPTRRATRPSRGSQARRVQGEKKRRAVKELRRRPPLG